VTSSSLLRQMEPKVEPERRRNDKPVEEGDPRGEVPDGAKGEDGEDDFEFED
jgi:hypothetical protein